MNAAPNLDRSPPFWLVVAMLLPLMLAVELACRVDDAIARRRARRRTQR